MALTFADLVERSGVDEATVRQLVKIGVTSAPDAPFESGDVQRVTTAAGFLRAGFTVEHLRSAIAANTISFASADAFELEPTERSTMTLADLAARTGASVARLRAIYGAFGLPLPDASTTLRKVEAEVLIGFLEAWNGAGPDATMRAARIVGDSIRRAAEGWVDLFVEQVSLPAMTQFTTYEAYADSTLRQATALAQLAPRLVVWLHARHSSHAMLEANLRHFERDLVNRQLIPEPERRLPVIAFADLVGFTRLTETEGDARAVDAAARLQLLAEEAALAHRGRVVKLLGDGAMLRFDDAADAASAMLGLAATIPEHGLGAAHLGLESGPVIERDGDVFGGTVNLAARLAGVAAPGEVVVGPRAAATLREAPGLALTPLAARDLKGFAAPVSVWRVQAAGGG